MQPFNHIMIDIETLGVSEDAVILAIAACNFNMNGEVGSSFFSKVGLEDNLVHGRKIDADTLRWWSKQRNDLRTILLSGSAFLEEALAELAIYMNSIVATTIRTVWSNRKLDFVVLEHAYRKARMDCPWGYWQERDVATISELKPEIKEEILLRWEGQAHNPVNDCLVQVKYLTDTLKALNISI